MAHLIDKSALVAEIERRFKEHHSGYKNALVDMLSFIDTLEVKEVDFDEEFDKFHIGMYNPFDSGAEIREFAKHFFELGLKAKDK